MNLFIFQLSPGLTKLLNLKNQFSPLLSSLTSMMGAGASNINIDFFSEKLEEMLPLIKQVSSNTKIRTKSWIYLQIL